MQRASTLGLFLCFSLLSPLVRATTVLPFTIDELSQQSPLVVYGQIVQIEVSDKTGQRWALLESKDIAKSPAEFKDQRDFWIPLHDRVIPKSGVVERVASSPEFQLNDEVVCFLRPVATENEGFRRRTDGARLFALMGFHQGRLQVFEDENHVRRTANWNQVPEATLTTASLIAQHTTGRQRSANLPKIPAGLAVKASDLATLDTVLNRARAAAGNSN